MTNTEKQTEALRLADCLERDIRLEWMEIDHNTAAAAELRRLDAEVRELKMTVQHESLCVEAAKERIEALDAENNALLAALEAVEMDAVEVGMGENVIGGLALHKVEDVLQQVRAAKAADKGAA